MLALAIGLLNGDEFSLDKSFLHFNVKKKYMPRVTLKEQSQSDCKY